MSSRRVVIAGGGFGGLFTALELENDAEVTLISRDDHFLFTPLLYEYFSREVEAWQIAPAYSELLEGSARIVHSEITGIDPLTRRVYASGAAHALEYDLLVLALGSTSNYWSIPGAAEHSLPFRTLRDADALRARMSQTFDRIPRGATLEEVRCFATFVVVGGGASGCELATKMSDLAREALQGAGIHGEPRIVLVEMSTQVVPEMGEGIRPFVEDALRDARVEVHTGTRVLEVKPGGVVIEQNGTRSEIYAGAVVWTAGVKVNPLVEKLDLPKERRGMLLVDPTLLVRNTADIFALGDIAYMDNIPPRLRGTAQLAVQQAALAGDNIRAVFDGKLLQTREFVEHGEAVSLGTARAAVVAGKRAFGGRLARQARFMMYTSRLPTWHHRLRVGASWFFEGTAHEPLRVHTH